MLSLLVSQFWLSQDMPQYIQRNFICEALGQREESNVTTMIFFIALPYELESY
jgi:hypothetical protein